MGYTMRNEQHRYTEWVSFDPETYYANFSEVKRIGNILIHSEYLIIDFFVHLENLVIWKISGIG